MKNILFFLLIGLWSCAPKIAKTIETKKEADIVEEKPRKMPNPPISIDGGIQINELYADIPNEIKVHVKGGNTKHLIVGATSGEIITLDVSKGMYSFSSKGSGMAVEIYAKDTINNVTIAKVYDVVPFPAPSAYVWTQRKYLPASGIPKMDVVTFRTQNVLNLYYPYRVPVRCVAHSFEIVRITNDGKKTSYINNNQLGDFDEEAKAMVQQARTGDIYVIKNIKANCTPHPIKDIVYCF